MNLENNYFYLLLGKNTEGIKMKKNSFRILKYTFIGLLVFLLFKIGVPRHYDTPPLQKRASTQFMDLSTGSRIAYTLLHAKGQTKKSTVIYLHGGPGGRINDRTIDVLSNLTNDGFDVFLYDQIGGGESGRLNNISDYTVDRHIKDLESIIKNLGTQKVILFGQSWGAILAVFYTSEHRNDIEKLIFTSPAPISPYPKALENAQAPDSFHLKSPIFTNAEVNEKVKNIRVSTLKYTAIHWGIKLATDDEADDFSTFSSYEINKSCVFDTSKIEKMSDVKSIPSKNGYYAGLMTYQNLMERQDPRPQLKDLNVPVLVLKGQYDNQKWGFTEEYLTIFKNHRLQVIPNAGHFIDLEQRDLYLKFIQKFLTE